MFYEKKLRNRISYLVLIVIGLFLFDVHNLQAATLQINSDNAILAPGETTTLYVVLNSEGQAVNNAETAITFPTDLVEVLSVSKSSSIFSMWVEEPVYSNSSGRVTFNGGAPTPGFTGARGIILSIVVRAKKVGDARFSFSGASVLANDGLGTNVLNGQSSKTLVISSKEKPPVQKEDPKPVDSKTNNLSLRISSVTHPDQAKWYKDSNPGFTWNIPTSVDAVKTGISENNASSPQVLYSPAISRKTLSNLTDGVWYFKVLPRQNSVWGSISSYTVRVDSTPPESKGVNFTYDSNQRTLGITANIEDPVSGIEYYEIFINDLLVKSVSASEWLNGQYSLVTEAIGTSTIKLLAFDRAGNNVEASGSFFGVVTPSATSVISDISGLAAYLDEAPFTVHLDSIDKKTSIDDKLIISGQVEQADLDVVIYFRNSLGELTVVNTKSSSEGNLLVLAPLLTPGNYEIWAETNLGNKVISSNHLYTQATARMLIKFGSLTITAISLFIPFLIILIGLLISMYLLGKKQRKLINRGGSTRQDYGLLLLSKKNFEYNIDLLQRVRRRRILTLAEKKIKAESEVLLDQIDNFLEKQKSIKKIRNNSRS